MALSITSVSAIILVISYGICYSMSWYMKKRRLFKLASKFEGPPTIPILGNLHQFIGDGEHMISKFRELSRKYPSSFRLWRGPNLLVIVGDPEQLKTICLSPKTLEKGGIFTHIAKPFVGTGILTAPVSLWKIHRKLIQPTFNIKILESFVGIFADQAKILTERMERHSGGPEFEIFNMVAASTLNMICGMYPTFPMYDYWINSWNELLQIVKETTMGVKIRAQTEKNCRYVEAVQKVISGMSKRIFRVWLFPDLFFHLSKLGKDVLKDLNFLHEFAENVIREKKKLISNRQKKLAEIDQETNACESVFRRKAFLDHFMTQSEGSNPFSDKALRDEVDTMIVSGNDTTAMTNSYAMLLLASHPDVQEKAYQELFEIYGDSGIEERPVASTDLPRMKYLQRVIKETLRLFPIIPYIIRDVTDDLEIGDKILPEGSSVVIPILNLQRNEKYWPDPLKFDPDRFLPEEIAKRHPYAFMAFSAGPRNCVGITYGLMAMKTLIATVLRKYILKKDNIVPIKDMRLTMEIVLKPLDPFEIRIEKRMRL